MTDHDLYLGQDDEYEYLTRHYTDGAVTVSTRPLGGRRWSPEVPMTLVPSEVP